MRFAGCAAVIFPLLCAGCTSPGSSVGSVRFWVVPLQETVWPDQTPQADNEIYDAGEALVRIEAAVNETVAFQLALRSGDQPSRIDSVDLTPLRLGQGQPAIEETRLYRESRIRVEDYPVWYHRTTPWLKQSREFPDVLIPLSAPRGALPIDLEVGRTEAVWVEIHVAPGTESGSYEGRLEITLADGKQSGLLVLLKVHPFALPQTRHLPVLAGLETAELLRAHLGEPGGDAPPLRLRSDDPRYEQARSIVDEAVQLLHRHRCSPILRDLRPIRQLNPDGQIQLNWSDYDRVVAGLLDGSAFEDREAVPFWPMPIDEEVPSPRAYGVWGSAQYERVMSDYLRQCVWHFQEQGWLDQHYVEMPLPATTRAGRYQQSQRVGAIVRSADPRLKLLSRLTPQSLEPYGWQGDPFLDLTQWISIWCPPGRFADAASWAAQRDRGKATWLSPDQPPYTGSLSVIASPSDARSLAWQAYRLKAGALDLAHINRWVPTDVPSAAGSEDSLIWPGAPYGLSGPVPSIRLKRLLRGLQDYEYLWLLEQNRRPAIAAFIASDLFRYGGTDCYGEHFLDGRAGGWAEEPGMWSLARTLMAREITDAIGRGDAGTAGADDDIRRIQQQIEWARYMQAALRVDARVEGVRVHYDARTPATPLIIEPTALVFNGARKPISARLTLQNPPADWVTSGSVEAINGLEPGHATRRVLSARSATLQPDANGMIPIEMVLKEVNVDPVVLQGRLCALVSQPLTRPIRIDGRLDEWPLAANVAGRFVLVGSGDMPKKNRPDPQLASQMTRVFLAHDDRALYFAFECRESNMPGRVISRTNFVHYEDLWPVGEDLVEVVLDPTGRAFAADGLWHIVVKANGAVAARHGVECLELITGSESQPFSVRAAVDDRTSQDRWTVELQIDLAAFGEVGQVWGVNFARFDAQRGEYSSWSPARSNIYTPLMLGNLWLPR